MQLHDLKSNTGSKSRKRVGRGGKKGTYSGRGVKGQKSRAGRKMEPMIRGIFKRFPKLRGSTSELMPKVLLHIVNLADLQEKFPQGGEITPKILIESQLIGTIKGKMPMVKILSKGEIKAKFQVSGCLISESAKKAIEKAGGVVK